MAVFFCGAQFDYTVKLVTAIEQKLFGGTLILKIMFAEKNTRIYQNLAAVDLL